MSSSEKNVEIIEKMLGEHISNINDITAGEQATLTNVILVSLLGYLLNNDPQKVLSVGGTELRKKISPLVKKIANSMLSNEQIFENRYKLVDSDSELEDKGIVLPNEPVIWASNHGFADDITATVVSTYRHAYLLLASLPQFFGTSDGLSAWLNGVILMNRKVKDSKKATIDKAKYAMNLGSDVIIFPEGVWNKTPNSLLLDFWPGIYRLSKETGAKVVPVVHYIRDCEHKINDNPIHTIIDDPVDITGMSEKEALEYLREIIGTWEYLLMEKYGKSTRAEELKGFNNADEAWEWHLNERVKTAKKYDTEIETCSDYRSKDVTKPIDVFYNIANIKNINSNNEEHVAYAKKLVKEERKKDFQRRF